jgi:hypothetical protein
MARRALDWYSRLARGATSGRLPLRVVDWEEVCVPVRVLIREPKKRWGAVTRAGLSGSTGGSSRRPTRLVDYAWLRTSFFKHLGSTRGMVQIWRPSAR